MIKTAQTTQKMKDGNTLICYPALRFCVIKKKNSNQTEEISIDDPRVPSSIRRSPGRRTFGGRQNKIAKLNIHTKLLSAKLQSIKIGKLLEAKKKH